jgi:uncharacterized protein YhfF
MKLFAGSVLALVGLVSSGASSSADTGPAAFACREGIDVAALSEARTRRFGDTPTTTARLTALILSGEKSITATSPWLYERDPALKPVAGGYSIMLDADGVARAVLRTIEVKTLPFDAVTEADSQYEGKPVRPILAWRKVHTDYFSRVLAPIGKSWSADMPVTLERFEVVCRGQ